MENIIKALQEQENYLLHSRERLEKLGRSCSESKDFLYERAKFIGMLDIAKLLKIDITNYSWIYNI